MKTKYLILGAGISGLSFASNLDSNDYIIIEKENTAGGLCRTHKTKSYTWDYAGHFFHFRNEETKKYFEPVVGENDECVKQEKNTKIYYKNGYVDYPFQKNIHQLPKDDFIDCLYHLYFKEERDQYKSFKDMLFGKFGKGICDRFLIPYNEKLYACDLDLLDKNAMGRFFPYADLADIIQNMKASHSSSYNDTFIYPYGGAQTVIDYLLGAINLRKLHLNEEVQFVDWKNHIITTNKNTYEYETLINTIPFNQFLDLCEIDHKEKLSWNKVLVFNIGFDKAPIDNSIHWIYYPDRNLNFYRIGFYNNILNQEKMSIYVEIGFGKNDSIDVETQYRLTLDNLKKCGLITDHEVVAYESIIIDPAYVHISNESQQFKAEIEEKLKENNAFSIGRYGAWTYCSMEDCFITAKELSNKISKGIG